MDGTVIEKLIVEWRADHAKFQQDMQRVKGLLAETSVANKTASASSDSFGTALTALGGKAMLIGAALQSLRMTVNTVKESIALAMDVTESENLFEVSLGNMSGSVRAWSEQMASSLGVNADEIRKTVGLWYTMGESLGLTSEQALGMSETFAKLKYDLMSFYNIDGSQADTIIKGLYSGETEPAKQIGVLLTEEVAKRALVTHGIIKEGQAVDSVTMLQGRYLAMMDQTTKAQGDMARTIDSPANQLRILESELRAAKLELGQAFLPIVKDVLPILRDFAVGLKTASSMFGDFLESLTGRRTFGLKEQVGAVNSATADGAAKWRAYGDSAGKGLDKASAGVSKLKAMIFGFDMLNVMSDNSTDAGGGTNNLDPKKQDIPGEKGAIPPPEKITANKNTSNTANTFGEMMENAGQTYKEILISDPLPDDISKETKTKLEPFLQLLNDAQVTMKKWAWGNQTITAEMAETISATTKEMGGRVKSAIKEQTTSSYNTMAEHFKNSEKLSTEEEAKILKQIQEEGEKKEKFVEGYTNDINAIYAKAAKEKRSLTAEENMQIEILNESMQLRAINSMTESVEEETRILTYMKEKSLEITAAQAADAVKNSLLTKEEIIKNANKTAEDTIAAALKQKEAGLITQTQYKDIVEAAYKSRDNTIAAAETTHKRVVEEAKKQAGEHKELVNWETGEIKKVWQAGLDATIKLLDISFGIPFRDFWNGIFKFFRDGYAELNGDVSNLTPEQSAAIKESLFPQSNTTKLPTLVNGKLVYRASGGIPEYGEMFVAREAGPEFVGRMGSKSVVANNDQIVDSVAGGVYQAMIASQGSNGGKGDIYLSVHVGNKAVYDIVVDEAQRQNIRSGKSIIQVGV